MARLILAGDIGGTKTLIGLYRTDAGNFELVRQSRYSSAAFPGLEAVCAAFLDDGTCVDAACFGVPGPVIDGHAEPSNLAWKLSEQSLSQALRAAPTKLINDLAATAHGVVHLRDGEYEVLNRGEPAARRGNIAIIAAGTGLGEGALAWDGAKYHAVASEGGHSSFAPVGDVQIELLLYLARRYGHVSWERILSGAGLVNIYGMLRERSGEPEPKWLADEIARDDPAAAISDAALGCRNAVCVDALAMFCAMYGSEAANLALKVLALGGVYLCGGIAPRIIPMLRRGEFMRAFCDKGRLAPLLNAIEVRVVTVSHTALVGAAHSAAELLC